MTDAVAIAFDGVTAGYRRGRPVLRDICGRWRRGEVTALLGPNGAGKSSLLRVALGQLGPWSGRCTVLGRSAWKCDPRWRAARVGYIPQQGGARFGFTVAQVVAMGRFASGDQAGVDEALQRCGLGEVAGTAFVELSGGQQRRVLVARALAQVHGRGEVVLADEPTAGLDLEHVQATMRSLRELADAGLAVVVVLHDLNTAARWADAAWLLDGGAVVAAGATAEVMTAEALEPVYRVRLREVEGAWLPSAGMLGA